MIKKLRWQILVVLVTLIVVAALLITPVIHRVLHRLHWEDASHDDDE